MLGHPADVGKGFLDGVDDLPPAGVTAVAVGEPERSESSGGVDRAVRLIADRDEPGVATVDGGEAARQRLEQDTSAQPRGRGQAGDTGRTDAHEPRSERQRPLERRPTRMLGRRRDVDARNRARSP